MYHDSELQVVRLDTLETNHCAVGKMCKTVHTEKPGHSYRADSIAKGQSQAPCSHSLQKMTLGFSTVCGIL